MAVNQIDVPLLANTAKKLEGSTVGEPGANLRIPFWSRQRPDADIVEPGHSGFHGDSHLSIQIAMMAFSSQTVTQLTDYNASAAYMYQMIAYEQNVYGDVLSMMAPWGFKTVR